MSEKTGLITAKDPDSYFENPDLKKFICFSISCSAIYPILFVITKLADGHSLFIVRSIVASGCGVIALLIAYFLSDFARASVETVAWSTIIEVNEHRELLKDEERADCYVTMEELSKISYNPLSPLAVWRILRIRQRISKYGHKRWVFWPLSIAFVAFSIIIAGALAFALGRSIDITTIWTFDERVYDEVPMLGDILDDPNPQGTYEGISQMLQRPYLEHDLRDPNPPAWEYDSPSSTQMQFGNETVYFTTPYAGQLRVNGTAYGAAIGASSTLFRNVTLNADDDSSMARELMFPQWGNQVSCKKLPNIATNVIPGFESAQVILPRDFVSDLYGTLGLQLPEETFQTLQPDYLPTGSLNRFFAPSADPGNGSTPNVLSTVTFRWDSKLNLSDPGPGTEKGRFIAGYITDTGIGGSGFTIFDVFIMRCYTSFNSPNQTNECANLPLVLPYVPGIPSVGYDAIACVQRTESYIISVRNSTQSVTMMEVVAKGQNLDGTVDASQKRRNALLDESIGRVLSSKTKGGQYYGMCVFSTWSWLSRAGDMGLLSELDKSWLEGTPGGISAPKFEKFRGVTAATSVLPLMVGPKQLVARQLKSEQVARTRILDGPMLIVIALAFLVGSFGIFCIPTLPKNHSRRRFDIFSLMIEVEGNGLGLSGDTYLIEPNMGLKDAEKSFENRKVVYKTP